MRRILRLRRLARQRRRQTCLLTKIERGPTDAKKPLYKLLKRVILISEVPHWYWSQ
jgi:hypothetical protein